MCTVAQGVFGQITESFVGRTMEFILFVINEVDDKAP